MSDLIHVHNLSAVGKHGVYDEERAEGRRFSVDATVSLTGRANWDADQLNTTLDYRDIASSILRVIDGPSAHLIETLAGRMCEEILGLDSRVASVRILIRKFATGVPGNPEWVGFEVLRLREDSASSEAPAPTAAEPYP